MTSIKPGLRVTLRFIQAWRQSPPPEAHFTRNGATPESRMATVEERRRKVIRSAQRDAYSEVLAGAVATLSDADELLDITASEIASLEAGLRNGSLDPRVVASAVADAVRTINAIHPALDRVEQDAASAYEVVNLDPADYEELQLDRFPHLEGALPMITEEYLLGEDNRDPLGGAK